MCGRGRFSTLASNRLNNVVINSHSREQTNLISGIDQIITIQERMPSTTKVVNQHKLVENLSPGMSCPVLICNSIESDSLNTTIQLNTIEMKWGLIPPFSFTIESDKIDHYKLFNKRIESLENNYYKSLLKHKRCVVIFDGFYEWKLIAGKKIPHYVTLGSAMQMAAIYDEAKLPDHLCSKYNIQTIISFSIITTDSCDNFAPMHNRQPLILSDDDMVEWLNPQSNGCIESIMNKYRLFSNEQINQNIRFFPVTEKVTNVQYQGDDCSIMKSFGPNLKSYFITPSKGIQSSIIECNKTDIIENISQSNTVVDNKGVIDLTDEKSECDDNPTDITEVTNNKKRNYDDNHYNYEINFKQNNCKQKPNQSGVKKSKTKSPSKNDKKSNNNNSIVNYFHQTVN
eukprot:gene5722-7904_t